ncbi:hypothetical protein GF327_10200 [Candidatus Woesearchaeota archaeon]|nr:hypothetical protein [Candidatus Woesearchaeota archaeon]
MTNHYKLIREAFSREFPYLQVYLDRHPESDIFEQTVFDNLLVHLEDKGFSDPLLSVEEDVKDLIERLNSSLESLDNLLEYYQGSLSVSQYNLLQCQVNEFQKNLSLIVFGHSLVADDTSKAEEFREELGLDQVVGSSNYVIKIQPVSSIGKRLDISSRKKTESKSLRILGYMESELGPLEQEGIDKLVAGSNAKLNNIEPPIFFLPDVLKKLAGFKLELEERTITPVDIMTENLPRVRYPEPAPFFYNYPDSRISRVTFTELVPDASDLVSLYKNLESTGRLASQAVTLARLRDSSFTSVHSHKRYSSDSPDVPIYQRFDDSLNNLRRYFNLEFKVGTAADNILQELGGFVIKEVDRQKENFFGTDRDGNVYNYLTGNLENPEEEFRKIVKRISGDCKDISPEKFREIVNSISKNLYSIDLERLSEPKPFTFELAQMLEHQDFAYSGEELIKWRYVGFIQYQLMNIINGWLGFTHPRQVPLPEKIPHPYGKRRIYPKDRDEIYRELRHAHNLAQLSHEISMIDPDTDSLEDYKEKMIMATDSYFYAHDKTERKKSRQKLESFELDCHVASAIRNMMSAGYVSRALQSDYEEAIALTQILTDEVRKQIEEEKRIFVGETREEILYKTLRSEGYLIGETLVKKYIESAHVSVINAVSQIFRHIGEYIEEEYNLPEINDWFDSLKSNDTDLETIISEIKDLSSNTEKDEERPEKLKRDITNLCKLLYHYHHPEFKTSKHEDQQLSAFEQYSQMLASINPPRSSRLETAKSIKKLIPLLYLEAVLYLMTNREINREIFGAGSVTKSIVRNLFDKEPVSLEKIDTDTRSNSYYIDHNYPKKDKKGNTKIRGTSLGYFVPDPNIHEIVKELTEAKSVDSVFVNIDGLIRYSDLYQGKLRRVDFENLLSIREAIGTGKLIPVSSYDEQKVRQFLEKNRPLVGEEFQRASERIIFEAGFRYENTIETESLENKVESEKFGIEFCSEHNQVLETIVFRPFSPSSQTYQVQRNRGEKYSFRFNYSDISEGFFDNIRNIFTPETLEKMDKLRELGFSREENKNKYLLFEKGNLKILVKPQRTRKFYVVSGISGKEFRPEFIEIHSDRINREYPGFSLSDLDENCINYINNIIELEDGLEKLIVPKKYTFRKSGKYSYSRKYVLNYRIGEENYRISLNLANRNLDSIENTPVRINIDVQKLILSGGKKIFKDLYSPGAFYRSIDFSLEFFEKLISKKYNIEDLKRVFGD